MYLCDWLQCSVWMPEEANKSASVPHPAVRDEVAPLGCWWRSNSLIALKQNIFHLAQTKMRRRKDKSSKTPIIYEPVLCHKNRFVMMKKPFDHINPWYVCVREGDRKCVRVCVCVLFAAVRDLLLSLFEPWQQLLFYVTAHNSEQTQISICEKHTSYFYVCLCVCVSRVCVCRAEKKKHWILWNDNGKRGNCHRENQRKSRCKMSFWLSHRRVVRIHLMLHSDFRLKCWCSASRCRSYTL